LGVRLALPADVKNVNHVARVFAASSLLTLFGSAIGASPAFADDKSGVEPSRLHLPKGPGSLEGIGENASANLAMGLLQYDVPLRLPEGYEGVTPALSLHYNSGAGDGVAGIGWDLGAPTIERMTKDGVPRYSVDDRFTRDGGEELSRIGKTNIYRARIEKGFVRYTWVDAAKAGAEGYWTAEYPDGRIGYFGATSDGGTVEQALVRGTNGIFRYHLVELVDPIGHHTLYQYDKDGATSILKKISYVFEGTTAPTPRYQVDRALGIDLRSGDADLIDINGDALPDVVSTKDPKHNFFVNHRPTTGAQGFQAPTAGSRGDLRLSADSVQILDVNGDGFSDMVDSKEGNVLWNTGDGDWTGESLAGIVGAPTFGDGNLRFFDYNNDKRVDIVHTERGATWYYENAGNGQFQLVNSGVDALGVGFVEDGVSLADMNGDGMLDLVRVIDNDVSYRLDMGWGKWTAWLPIGAIAQERQGEARFVDVNGDALSDAVILRGDTIVVWLNRNATSWDPPLTLTASAALPFPITDSSMSVRFADMNGNGSVDVAWVDPSGSVTYLELFPKRPNLLTRITSAIGKVIEIGYGTSAEHMAQDEGTRPWDRRLPHVMQTVDSIKVGCPGGVLSPRCKG
jgi:hypothetical protein